MIFTKGAHQNANFQTFDCSGEILANLYFDKLLLLKVYKISGKKLQKSYVRWYWGVEQNLKKEFEEFFVSKMSRIWRILIQALKSLKNLHLDWSFLCKAYNYWSKKVQRSYISWRWRVVQILKKNWLVVWKMTWGIWQIFMRTLENIKIGTFMEYFCPKEKMHQLKIYRGVMCNDTEKWWKIWRRTDMLFQNWQKGVWRILTQEL